MAFWLGYIVGAGTVWLIVLAMNGAKEFRDDTKRLETSKDNKGQNTSIDRQ